MAARHGPAVRGSMRELQNRLLLDTGGIVQIGPERTAPEKRASQSVLKYLAKPLNLAGDVHGILTSRRDARWSWDTARRRDKAEFSFVSMPGVTIRLLASCCSCLDRSHQ